MDMDMLDSLSLSSTVVSWVALGQEKGDTGLRWDLGCVVCVVRVYGITAQPCWGGIWFWGDGVGSGRLAFIMQG